MSHWVKSKSKVKDPQRIFEVAKSKGCTINTKVKRYSTHYTGEIACEGVIQGPHGGSCCVVKDGDSYRIQMDNYGNRIVDLIGQNGDVLMRDVVVDEITEIAMLEGHTLEDIEVKPDGQVVVEINV